MISGANIQTLFGVQVGGEQLDAYLRISSIAVAIWECVERLSTPRVSALIYMSSYLWTLPMEYRLYKSQKSFRRMRYLTLGLILTHLPLLTVTLAL